METEAKFLVRDRRAWRAVGRQTSLGPFRLSRQKTERQTNLYWDTPDLRLRKARAALKLRTIGSRGELTFKREVAYRGGISRRIEVTAAIMPPRPRVSSASSRPRRSGRSHLAPIAKRVLVIPRTAILPPVTRLEPVRRARQITGDRPLERVLTLKTFRRRRIFAHRGARIEMDLDRVSVLSGGRRVAVYEEVELENLGASGSLFADAVRAFRRSWAGRLRPSRRSKYEIGLRLLRGR